MSQVPTPHNNGPTPQPASQGTSASTQTPSHTYAIKIEYGKFVSCSDETHQDTAQISGDGLKLKVDNFTAKISHQLPGRLVIKYDNPHNGQTDVFFRVLRDGIFKLITGKKPKAHWDSIEPIEPLFQGRFGITKVQRNDPNSIYEEFSCQHEGPDGRHHFCFVLTDGAVRTFLVDDLAGNFDPDSPEDMFFYRGDIEYRVKGATWTVVGVATVDADSSIIDKDIRLYVDSSQPNLYLLAIELDRYLHEHDHGTFDDYIGELKDLI